MNRAPRNRLLAEYPNLAAYIARGEARPAFKRALRRSALCSPPNLHETER